MRRCGTGGNSRVRRRQRRAQAAALEAAERAEALWLDSLYDDCRCCNGCWERPCGGCQSGGVCDGAICTCDDDLFDEDSSYDIDLDDEDSWEVRQDIADMEAEYRRSVVARGEVY